MLESLIAVILLVIATALGALIVFVMRARAPATDLADEQRMAELNARIQTMGDLLAKAHAQLQQTMHERLDAVSTRLGESMQNSTKHTAEHLQQLHARLAVIDNAQKYISDLATQVTTLQNVLTNKQSRGAFGQSRMEIIIQDGLPKNSYRFQEPLSNDTRPDCCVLLPDSLPLVIDSKFPLEAVTALREAKTEDESKAARARVRTDVSKHVADIAKKYLIPGETQDMALMFVPSESIYAELYDGFEDVFQKAYRAKVIIVSPSLLMLAIQVIQQIRKDAKMREAADQILHEVNLLVADVHRLKDRVGQLNKHFGNMNDDLKQITLSADKIVKRGEKIQEVDFNGGAETATIAAPVHKLGAAE